ncbi:MAG: aminodeoxychorismate synthase component I [Spirosoma sp.]|nr:aminodeoxychorismate synthase component I [Spirosoma sp.]
MARRIHRRRKNQLLRRFRCSLPVLPVSFITQLNRFGQRREPVLFLIDFARQQPLFWPLRDVDPTVVQVSFNGVCYPDRQPKAGSTTRSSTDFFFDKSPVSFADYQPRFDYVVQQIRQGNSFLVNLSQPTPVTTNRSLEALFRDSQARYKVWLRHPVAGEFVCFSPEAFVQIRGNRIASFPMKGTIDAHLSNAGQRILSDPKEAAEHATIVDLIRNDLSQIADKIWVERYRYLDHIETERGALLQVSSEIAGLLPSDWPNSLGDMLAQLLPAGSITGAPKPKTLEIIRTAEGYERGFYTGICGVFDGQNLDTGVMIRFIEKRDEQLVFKSGGGITAQSNARAEHQELIDKVYVPIVVPQPAVV